MCNFVCRNISIILIYIEIRFWLAFFFANPKKVRIFAIGNQ